MVPGHLLESNVAPVVRLTEAFCPRTFGTDALPRFAEPFLPQGGTTPQASATRRLQQTVSLGIHLASRTLRELALPAERFFEIFIDAAFAF